MWVNRNYFLKQDNLENTMAAAESIRLQETKIFSSAKLTQESTQLISKNITDMVYNSLTTKDASQRNQRLDVLAMLHKWCINGLNHFKISYSNHDCFVDCLVNVSSNAEFTGKDLLANNVVDDYDALQFNKTQAVINYYKKLKSVSDEKSKVLEILRSRDRRRNCGDNNMFDVNYHIPADCNYNLEFLNNHSDCSSTTNNKGKWVERKLPGSKDKLREKQINLGYSLLNLNKYANHISLLHRILQNLGSRETLEVTESDFIKYIWHNHEKLGLPQEIPLMLLESFSFIYEKCVINMCTNAVRNNDTTIPQDVSKVLQLISSNGKLRCNINNLIHELYACSGYSSKLYGFLTLIN